MPINIEVSIRGIVRIFDLYSKHSEQKESAQKLEFCIAADWTDNCPKF